jgi:S1-C subfamily serine protease
MTVTVQLAARSPGEMRRYDDAVFGFRARDLAERDLEEPRLKGVTEGVMVDGVEPGGWAALARLSTGDVITVVDGQPVGSLDPLMQTLKAAQMAKAASVVFRVRRGVRTLFVEIEPSWPK